MIGILLFFASLGFACEEHAAAAKKTGLLASTKMQGLVPETKSYGSGVTLSETPLLLSQALSQREALAGKEIVVKAMVGKVCQSKGCWMTLKEGEREIRVTFANYSFFVPKNSSQQEALVQGKIFEKEVSAAEARHYAKDEGLPPAEIKKITEAKKVPWFEASGLTLKKL